MVTDWESDSVVAAPIPELAHGHGADGHSGEYLRRLEILAAVGHVEGREGTVRCIQGRLGGSQHCRNHQRRLLEVHRVERAERSTQVALPKMCPPVEGVTGGAFCALKPLTSSDGFCAASPWQTSERERQLGHLRRRHGRALRLALGTVGFAPLCPVARAPDPDPRSREAPRSSLVHASRPLWAHAFQEPVQGPRSARLPGECIIFTTRSTSTAITSFRSCPSKRRRSDDL